MSKRDKKLVRDEYAHLLPPDSFRIASSEEIIPLLLNKLVEEANEFREKPSVQEMADVQEVLVALAWELNITSEELHEVLEEKHDRLGGFEHGIVLLEDEESQ